MDDSPEVFVDNNKAPVFDQSDIISSLPLDVRYSLLTEYIGAEGIARLHLSCKSIRNLCHDERIWCRLCSLELGVKIKNLQTPCRHIIQSQDESETLHARVVSPLSYHTLYTQLLHPLRGFFNQALFSFTSVYGEILTLTYRDGTVYGELWYPPAEISDDMTSTLDFIVYIDEATGQVRVWNEFSSPAVLGADWECQMLTDHVKRSTAESYPNSGLLEQITCQFRQHTLNTITLNKLRAFLSDHKASWSSFRPARLADLRSDDINAQARHFFDLGWSGSPLKRQSAFVRHKDISARGSVSVPFLRDLEATLPQGLFKGTYGGHGNEMIMVKLECLANEASKSAWCLTGLKLTGDPNVPAGQVTFHFPTESSIALRLDQQDDVEFLETIPGVAPSDGGLQAQPFKLPNSPDFLRRIDPRTLPDTCCGRLVGEATIANHGFENPQTIPSHMVVFSATRFLILWFGGLNSASLFERVSAGDRFAHFLA